MGMAVGAEGKGKNPAPDMNVTPLIDVVLVLLIIFMAMAPMMNKKFWVHMPKQEKEEVEALPPDPNPPLVMHVGADQSIVVNGVTLSVDEVPQRLRRMFAARDDHVLFFDAADDASLGFAVKAMDLAREGGAVTIATLTTAIGGSHSAEAENSSSLAPLPPS